MKRGGAVILILIILIFALPGCNKTGEIPGEIDIINEPVVLGAFSPMGDNDALSSISCRGETGGSAISVVCTIFPAYDWARRIIGDLAGDFDVFLLLGGRADLHSYQPTVDDIVKITTCDLFIYVGGESDKWVEDVLKQSINEDMVALNLVEMLGSAAKIEEDPEADEDEYDEHVWLSLRNASLFCRSIAGALSVLDSENAATYSTNLADYLSELESLDNAYTAATTAASANVLLFCSRFPFRYLMDDYSIEYYAAFPGCSAETEASFGTVVFLAGKINELDLKYVLETESDDQSLANVVINSTANKNQTIVKLDSMQSVSINDIQNGKTFLSIMESNLEVLKEALS